MAYIKQRGRTDCGVACLAMLCDVSYEDAMRVIPWRRRGVLEGTSTTQLREGGAKLGYRVVATPKDRLIPLRGKGWEAIPNNSLVKIPQPKGGNWHWVVWRKGKIYDPANGVYKPSKYWLGEPTSYMQFVDQFKGVLP